LNSCKNGTGKEKGKGSGKGRRSESEMNWDKNGRKGERFKNAEAEGISQGRSR
jgi:hypothetical protein